MRLVFMGTPEAAVPSLRAVAERFDVVEVYTRRDRPKGRGRKVAPSPVKVAAEELQLRIVQPKTLRDQAEHLRSLGLDAIAVVAYGMILPAGVLDAPRLGCVNVHFSLLPRWRGAAPVEHAILAGDERTGVTTMLMDAGLDTGPALYERVVSIAPDDTTGTLTQRLAALAPDLLVRTIEDLDAGSVRPRPQDEGAATLAPKIEPSHARLDPGRPAAELARVVRAMNPAPGAYVDFRDGRLKVWQASVDSGEGPPLQTAQGRLVLVEVQPEGRKRMPGDAFIRGYRPQPSDFGSGR
ncbi:MAG TPA: methionyl-tRNA formyltransferase [Actinomycetota bacterium]|nr:methionyl-tRNA formyltransferase [Actinomycetota bacterium]